MAVWVWRDTHFAPVDERYLALGVVVVPEDGRTPEETALDALLAGGDDG